MRAISVGVCALFFAGTIYADQPVVVPKLGSGVPVQILPNELNSTYRIGDEWGKRAPSEADFEQVKHLRRVAQATAKVGGATGFYIGSYNGRHVVATNNHVCPRSCEGSRVEFPLLGIKARVNKFFGTWTGVDFALMSIDVSGEDAAVLAQNALSIDFHSPIYLEQPLITVGYGRANNAFGRLVANWDSDCKVFSNENEFRFMADPDRLNPGPNLTWSFSNGCDVSHGDSGSAIVDRNTGMVIGIIWTGSIPKAKSVQSSAYLEQMISSGSEEIWTALSYAAPAHKIAEILDEVVQTTSDQDTRATLQAILAN
jgi:S1-C subfamily serine protease